MTRSKLEIRSGLKTIVSTVTEVHIKRGKIFEIYNYLSTIGRQSCISNHNTTKYCIYSWSSWPIHATSVYAIQVLKNIAKKRRDMEGRERSQLHSHYSITTDTSYPQHVLKKLLIHFSSSFNLLNSKWYSILEQKERSNKLEFKILQKQREHKLLLVIFGRGRKQKDLRFQNLRL